MRRLAELRASRSSHWILNACLVYIGASVVISQYLSVGVGPVTVSLLVAGLVAVRGWQQLPGVRIVGWYIVVGGLLAYWVLVSSLASWDRGSAYQAAIFAGWLVFVLPGLASVTSDRRSRNALITGWAIGVAVYVLTANIRLLTVGEVFDDADPTSSRLLGENRNSVNLLVVVVLPYLLLGEGGRLLRIVRWPLAVLIGSWVIQSAGRAGFISIAMVLLVTAVTQPGLSQRLKRLVVVGAMAVFALTAIQESGGRTAVSYTRLLDFSRGERTDPDKARQLLLRKAWHLAAENPAFGVGFTRFETTYHRVIEEAETPRVREIAGSFHEHNTFAAIMSETGFPGLFAFVSLFVLLFVAGYRRIANRVSRAAVASCAGLVLSIFFQSANGPRLFIPIALLLSTCIAPRSGHTLDDEGRRDSHERSALGTHPTGVVPS